MKKFLRTALVFALSAAAAFMLASCGSNDTTTDEADEPTAVSTDEAKPQTDGDKSENKDENKDGEETKTETSSEKEEVKVKPTFKYFVSGTDKDYDKTMKIVEELKTEYEDKVVFDIVNVDEQPEVLENFAMVKDNTPYLIMLNTSNDICALSPKLTDKSEMENTIEGALE